MLRRVETDQTRAITPDHRFRRDHLGIEPGMRAQLAVEETAMPVRPLHHRGYGKYMCLTFLHYFAIFQRLSDLPSHFFILENTPLFASVRRLGVMDL
jgi:hypothetical protein